MGTTNLPPGVPPPPPPEPEDDETVYPARKQQDPHYWEGVGPVEWNQIKDIEKELTGPELERLYELEHGEE